MANKSRKKSEQDESVDLIPDGTEEESVPKKTKADKPGKGAMHDGHRERMYNRLSKDDTLEDHELLELLLFFVIPRKNTNETAHLLLNSCKSLSGVFHTNPTVLQSVEGVGPQTSYFLRGIGELYDRMGKEGLRPKGGDPFSFSEFRKHVQEKYKPFNYEVLEFYSVDSKDRITFSSMISSGENDHVAVAPEDITKFLAENKPSGFAVAHNHPNASCLPSERDNDFTKRIHLICALNNVRFLDHVIVGNDAVYSYRLTGQLGRIEKQCDIDRLIHSDLPPEW